MESESTINMSEVCRCLCKLCLIINHFNFSDQKDDFVLGGRKLQKRRSCQHRSLVPEACQGGFSVAGDVRVAMSGSGAGGSSGAINNNPSASSTSAHHHKYVWRTPLFDLEFVDIKTTKRRRSKGKATPLTPLSP